MAGLSTSRAPCRLWPPGSGRQVRGRFATLGACVCFRTVNFMARTFGCRYGTDSGRLLLAPAFHAWRLCVAGGRELAPLPAEMEALAEELRRGEGLLLADELPPEGVTAKAAFAASVRAFLLQQARRLGR